MFVRRFRISQHEKGLITTLTASEGTASVKQIEPTKKL